MTRPETTSEWFALFKKQLKGEAEPVVEPDYEDDSMNEPRTTRRDWE